MKLHRLKIETRIRTATAQAGAEYFKWQERLRNPQDKTLYLQTLLSMSTFNCNKPVVAEMLKLLVPDAGIDWNSLDTNSESRLNILYPLGTAVVFILPHDRHGYPLSVPVLVTAHIPWKDDGKIYHRGFYRNADGQYVFGKFFYLYSFFNAAFIPSMAHAEAFISQLPDETNDADLIKACELICADT